MRQEKQCALTGRDLYFYERGNSRGNASLDRIDSKLGYIQGNVQWVLNDVNIMKNKYDEDYFLSICQDVCKKKQLSVKFL